MRVVVTLSTIPSREESVIKTIESLQKGIYKLDAIYVCLPKWYPRFKCAPKPGLAEAITNVGGTVIECEDMGVFTKVIPTLSVETDPFTLIITGDDDAIYSENFVAGLVHGYSEFHCPVAYSGLLYPETALEVSGNLGYHVIHGHGAPIEMFECVFGVAIPRWAMFGWPEVKPQGPDSQRCLYYSDDYFYCKFFDAKGIPKRLLNYDQIGRKGDDWANILSFHSAASVNALSSGNNLQTFMDAGKIFKFQKQIIG